MFRIKICGVTSGNDARAAKEFGADALGLNFYEPSPRSILPAKIDLRPFPVGVVRVGVFVNADAQVIETRRTMLGVAGRTHSGLDSWRGRCAVPEVRIC